MKLAHLTMEAEYDREHKCLTPGAIYSTEVHGTDITVSVQLPEKIQLPISTEEAKQLEIDLHYAIEQVLRKFFIE